LMPLLSKIPVRYARTVHAASLDTHKVMEAAALAVDTELKLSGLDLLRSNAALKSCFTAAWQQLSDSLAFALDSNTSSPDPQQWKEAAFREELCNENEIVQNVISIGDSVYERDALHNVVADLQMEKRQCNAKTAKLLDGPSISSLIHQLSFVHDSITEIVEHDGPVDVEIDADCLHIDMNAVVSI